MPQPRPHGEQDATARALAAASLATVCPRWPQPREWPALLEQAVGVDGDRWACWAPGDGARQAALLLDTLAAPPA